MLGLQAGTMPIYEFECQNCGTCFEEFLQSGDSTENLTCIECGSMDIKKIVSAFGFRTRQRVKGDYKPDPECEDYSCIPHHPRRRPRRTKDYKPGSYLKQLPQHKDKFKD